MLQIGRRFKGDEVVNSYSEGEIYELTTTVTTCVLVVISRFLAKQGHADDAKAIDGLARNLRSGSRRSKGLATKTGNYLFDSPTVSCLALSCIANQRKRFDKLSTSLCLRLHSSYSACNSSLT